LSEWIDEGGSGSPVDVAGFMDSRIPELFGRIVAAGALLSVGSTSDGGAIGITVTLDGRWRRQWFRESDEAVDWLEAGASWLEAQRPPSAAPSAHRERIRRSRAR
jgi:hypothetical protein